MKNVYNHKNKHFNHNETNLIQSNARHSSLKLQNESKSVSRSGLVILLKNLFL